MHPVREQSPQRRSRSPLRRTEQTPVLAHEETSVHNGTSARPQGLQRYSGQAVSASRATVREPVELPRRLAGPCGAIIGIVVASVTALDRLVRRIEHSSRRTVVQLPSNKRHAERPTGGLFRPIKCRSSLLAAHIACRHSKARDLLSGSKMKLQDSIDRHHILPRAQFTREQRAGADTIANIAFITNENNKTIGANTPKCLLRAIKKEVLDSQCIPANPRTVVHRSG